MTQEHDYRTFEKLLTDIDANNKGIENSSKQLSRFHISLKERLLFFIQKNNPKKEQYKFNRDIYTGVLKRNTEELEKNMNYLNQVSTFEFNATMEFISRVLSIIEEKEFQIKQNGIYTLIEPIFKEDISAVINDSISIKTSEKITLFDAETKEIPREFFQKYPYLAEIIMDLLKYKKGNYNLETKQIFDFMLESISINHDNLLKENNPHKIKIDARFKEYATKLAASLSSWTENDEKWIYGVSKNEALSFYERFKNGEYNNLLDTKFWFGENISLAILMRWDRARMELEKSGLSCNKITRENYLAFTVIDSIVQHMKTVAKATIENGGYTALHTCHTQTAATQEEQEIINEAVNKTLQRNHSWRDSRDLMIKCSRLKIYEDYEFPHNTKKIEATLTPTVRVFYPSFSEGKCSHNIEEVKTAAYEMLEELKQSGLKNLFVRPSKNHIEEYLRRMILSQYDIPKIINNNSGSFKDGLEIISKELEAGTQLSQDASKILFSNSQNNKELMDLAKGTLISLTIDTKPKNILKSCVDLQKALGCWQGTVGPNDSNTLKLPNGDIIYSIWCEDIEPQFMVFQKEFEFFYNNASDLEFVEGCVDLMGKILMTQIFRNGNKRTAKCIFNTLLASRGIVPPVIDLNQNERELWDKFAYERYNRYPQATLDILKLTTNLGKQFDENKFNMPTIVSMDALNRNEFKRRYY